ncbi:MAG: poly-beta-1,6-N-acetyl-D-glucosamine N-deacetylase PgaB [Pelosinus sp.]|nr:poly-beta-1,6-N-acetyl-D-glucosamine N-deacetylase PgaB [Pelosinus sp.]
MRKTRLIIALLALLCLLPASLAAGVGAQDVAILCYHDVGIGKLRNEYAMTLENLEAHFAYIRDNGYHPISVEQYIAANRGEMTLPDKPVLLSFDDGYASWYKTVFPLLKKYNYPAMLAIITSMPDAYNPSELGPVLSWQQIKEMDDSGLISFASHSHDSHRYQPMNPFGDSEQKMESFGYANGRYESEHQFKARIKSDLSQSQAAFAQHLGHTVKAMVWPFGSYNQIAREIGQEQGFEAFFGLGGGFNKLSPDTLLNSKRGIVMNNMNVTEFAGFLRSGGLDHRVINGAQLDIDMIYDKDPAQMELNISEAIRRFDEAKINTVFLQTFSDSDGSGNIQSVYFKTEQAPVKADVFSHIASRLRSDGIWVFAWLPTLSNQWLLKSYPEAQVTAQPSKNAGWYKRVTPFSPEVHKALRGLVDDLMQYSNVDGILFQDDLYLNDFEDFSPAAKAAFRQQTGQELTAQALADNEVKAAFTKLKTRALSDLTRELIGEAKVYHPYILTARNLYPGLVIQPESEDWFAQNYQEYLENYDYTVIMAYPYLEKQYDQPVAWLEKLTMKALQDKAKRDKVIFKLQAYDWNKNRWLSAKELREQKSAIQGKGGLHFAYYPENVFGEQ